MRARQSASPSQSSEDQECEQSQRMASVKKRMDACILCKAIHADCCHQTCQVVISNTPMQPQSNSPVALQSLVETGSKRCRLRMKTHNVISNVHTGSCQRSSACSINATQSLSKTPGSPPGKERRGKSNEVMALLLSRTFRDRGIGFSNFQ